MTETRHKLICFFLGLFAAGLPTAAGALDMVLVLPAEKVVAGQVLQVAIYLTNSTAKTETAVLPESLAVRLRPADPAKPMTVTAISERGATRMPVAPGRFHRVFYTLDLPSDLEGPVWLEIVDRPVRPLMFAVYPDGGPKPVSHKAVEQPPSRLDKLANNFFGHEPVYFLVGANPSHAKFQISFKYQLLNPEGSLASRWQRFENIYFGYTQTSFWDWAAESAPFYDSSYKPELFYYRPDIPQDAIKWISRFSFQGGLQHESNGKAGADSRSLNMFYLKPGALIETGASSYFTVAPRVWAYIGDLGDNPDIDRYRGYFDLEMAWELKDSWKLAATLRKGTGAGKGSAQFDATYPLGEILQGNLDVFLQLQYYTGYAETLRAYDQSYDFFRIGFAMFR